MVTMQYSTGREKQIWGLVTVEQNDAADQTFPWNCLDFPWI